MSCRPRPAFPALLDRERAGASAKERDAAAAVDALQAAAAEPRGTPAPDLRVDPRSAARPGGRLELAVDPSRFHFFDPESGARLASAPAELQAAR